MQIEWHKGKPKFGGWYFVVPSWTVDPNKHESEQQMLDSKMVVASVYYSGLDQKFYTDDRRQFALKDDEIYVWTEQFYYTNEELMQEVGDREVIDI